MLIGSWRGGKILKGREFLSKNLLGSGYRKQTTFLGINSNIDYGAP